MDSPKVGEWWDVEIANEDRSKIVRGQVVQWSHWAFLTHEGLMLFTDESLLGPKTRVKRLVRRVEPPMPASYWWQFWK